MNISNKRAKSTSKIPCRSVKLEKLGESLLHSLKDRAEAVREEAVRASCLLLVKEGGAALSDPSKINALMTLHAFHSRHSVWRTTGGLSKVIPKLQGEVLPPGFMGEWTPDFWAGFKLSGAIIRIWRGSWKTGDLACRPAVEAVFKSNLPFSCRASRLNFGSRSKQSKQQQTRKRGRPRKGESKKPSKPSKPCTKYCLSLMDFWAPLTATPIPVASTGMSSNPIDGMGVGVLAGLLAGSRRVEVKGDGGHMESWLWLQGHSGLVGHVLESFGVPFVEHRNLNGGGHKVFLVSPFWGALLSKEMPGGFRPWFEEVRERKAGHPSGVRVGMCPLLPWAFLKGAWGGRGDDLPLVVPFIVHRHSLVSSTGIPLGKVREAGFVRLGMRRVDGRVRAAWLRKLALEGVGLGDFPEGKIPVDFVPSICDDVCV